MDGKPRLGLTVGYYWCLLLLEGSEPEASAYLKPLAVLQGYIFPPFCVLTLSACAGGYKRWELVLPHPVFDKLAIASFHPAASVITPLIPVTVDKLRGYRFLGYVS